MPSERKVKWCWHPKENETVKVYKEHNRYYFVDVIKFGRGQCPFANDSNVFDKEPTEKKERTYDSSVPLKVTYKIDISIKFSDNGSLSGSGSVEDRKYFDHGCDIESIVYGGENTQILKTITVVEVSGFDGTHYCSYCEEFSIKLEEGDDPDRHLCVGCKRSSFHPMESFLASYGEVPNVGDTHKYTCTGR